MNEFDRFKPQPVSARILDNLRKNGVCIECLTGDDLVNLFREQAERDDSGDKPILRKSCFEYFKGKVNFTFDYFVTEGIDDNEKRWMGLKLSGTMTNGEDGFLSKDQHVSIMPGDIKTLERVYDAFGTKDSLPVETFFKSMIEDALRPEAKIISMKLISNKLSLILKQDHLLRAKNAKFDTTMSNSQPAV